MEEIVKEVKALQDYAFKINRKSWQWQAVKNRIKELQNIYNKNYELPERLLRYKGW